MPSFASKTKTTSRIKEVRKALARILSDLEFLASVKFDRDNNLGWDIVEGVGANEFTAAEASDLGFPTVDAMRARLNQSIDAADAIKANFSVDLASSATGA